MDTSNEMSTANSFPSENHDHHGHYERLRLGLVMNLVYHLCGNKRIAVLTCIYLTIAINTFDTSSDLVLVIFVVMGTGTGAGTAPTEYLRRPTQMCSKPVVLRSRSGRACSRHPSTGLCW